MYTDTVLRTNLKLIIIIILLFACANRLISPPSKKIDKSTDNISINYANDYNKLKKDAVFDCTYFKQRDLSNFPLKKIIDLHLEVFCGSKQINTAKWLNKLKLELILSKKVDNNLYVKSILKYLKYIKTQHQKEKYLFTAINKMKKRKKGDLKNNNLLSKKLENKLYNISPRLNPKIEKDNYYLIARDYERNRKFKTARKFYQKILLSNKESLLVRIKSWERTLKTYKNERKKKKYLISIYKFRRWLRKQKKLSPKYHNLLSRSHQKWSIRLSRTLWSLNQSSKAKYFLINELRKKSYTKTNQALMNWLIAQIWLEKKELQKAIKYLNQAIKIEQNNLKIKENILWSLSFSNILLQNYKEASTILANNISALEKTAPHPRLQFWLAYCYKELGNLIYKEKFKKLAENHPFNYYGIISKIILKEPFESIKITKPLFPSENLTFSWLYYLKDKDLIAQYTKYNISRSKVDLRSYFSYMYYSKEYNNAIFNYYALKYNKRADLKDIAISFLFPTPFKKEIISISKEIGIKAPLVFSITRQESAFNPLARSHADAFGLMQLIPRRAKEMAKLLNIKYKNQNDLYNPTTNITMGSQLLKQTLKGYHNNFVKTVASYNAGTGVIANWFKHRFDGNYYKFIELIPYRETRKYVKLTFRNYIIYKQLLSKKSFMINENIFKNLNNSYEYLAVSQN